MRQLHRDRERLRRRRQQQHLERDEEIQRRHEENDAEDDAPDQPDAVQPGPDVVDGQVERALPIGDNLELIDDQPPPVLNASQQQNNEEFEAQTASQDELQRIMPANDVQNQANDRRVEQANRQILIEERQREDGRLRRLQVNAERQRQRRQRIRNEERHRAIAAQRNPVHRNEQIENEEHVENILAPQDRDDANFNENRPGDPLSQNVLGNEEGLVGQVQPQLQPQVAQIDLPAARHGFGNAPQPFYLGAMTVECHFCRALRFPGEKLNCCHNGKLSHLPLLTPCPEELVPLFTQNNQRANSFRNNIRDYNSAFAFASFGTTIENLPGRGRCVFKIHGQVYHHVQTLHPPAGEDRRFGQLYILEGDEAVEGRMRLPANRNLDRDLVGLIAGIMHRMSPYAAAYKHMHQVVEEHRDEPNQQVTMVIVRGRDQRRYNEPRHDEVAAIFVGDDGAPPQERDIVIHPRNRPPEQISYMSANCDPMTYPLLFPSGDLGWVDGTHHHEQHRTQVRDKVTHLQYYSYRLAVRPGFSALHCAEKLFQQYIVDAYVKTEASRLFFIRNQQPRLRAELYQGIMDHIHNAAQQRDLIPGRMVILPSTFQGSPRALANNYQDAMAIVGKFGKPDLFITFTCNKRIEEMMESLTPPQKIEHRPDIVCRVFFHHFEEFLHDIRDRHVLGKPTAYVYVVEFQKRGLPHVHLLLMLEEDSKPRTPEDIDNLISAEIPDPDRHPMLHQIVTTCMMHGPCGPQNMNNVCMVNGRCSAGFPKPFAEETTILENAFPRLRRRANGRTVRIGNGELDNR